MCKRLKNFKFPIPKSRMGNPNYDLIKNGTFIILNIFLFMVPNNNRFFGVF